MKLSTRGVAMAVGALVFIGISLPTHTEAASANVLTAQVLPTGGSQCALLPVGDIVTYMQDGELQSFDVVIGDASYVALIAAVGSTSVPFNQMSRWSGADGTVKVHVDIESTPIYGSVPVTMTLLSSPSGKPTCLSTVSFSVLGNSTPKQSPVSVVPTPKPASSTVSTGQGQATSTGTASAFTPVVGGSVQRALERACATASPFQLWLVLLALYAVIVILAAIAQPPLAERSPALPFAVILIPTLLLVAFWYFAPLCRGASWIPVVVMVGAILGLLVALREREEIARVIQLPAPKPVPQAAPKTPTSPTTPKKS